MRDNPLVTLSRQFAVDVIHICEELREKKNNTVLSNQLLRCGTSIGANIHEANYASSEADFVNKLHIALKECYETEYWLGLLCETSDISSDSFKNCMTTAARSDGCSWRPSLRRKRTYQKEIRILTSK